MDLLFKAYSNTSDDEPEPEPDPEPKPVNHHHLPFRPSKRPKPEYLFPTLDLQKREEAPLPGRYISKRERALAGAVSQAHEPNPIHRDHHVINQSVLGSISELDLPHDVLSLMRHKPKGRTQLSQIPGKLSVALHGHAKAVNAVHWSPTHVYSSSTCFCGDGSNNLHMECMEQRDDQVVGVIKFHPDDSNLFLSGGSKGRLRLWDVRTGKVVHEYIRGLGPILDVEFSTDGKQFVSSSDVSGSNISENSIIVWDISRQVPLSNEVYAEAYTCPCVRYHPFDPYFVAQSNGNYTFSLQNLPSS
ncbi:hypothetical protein V6Z11_A01G076100 [Gossypium hirsutum]